MPMDLISVDLREALDALSEITEISSEDVLDHVFGEFLCWEIGDFLFSYFFCEKVNKCGTI